MPHEPHLHLMCHSFEVQTVKGLRRTWNRPDRVQPGPVLTATEPWEGTSALTWGTVHYDAAARRFTMWYEAWNPEPDRPPPLDTPVCYATSVDGIHWDKPNLGLWEWNGSRANNITWMMRGTGDWNYLDSPRVFVEPKAPASERYKMVIYTRPIPVRRQAFFVLTSPDGTHWTWRDEPFLTDSGDRFQCVYDDRRREYWLTTRRRWIQQDRRADPARPGIRTVEGWRSPDLKTWSDPRHLLKPDDADPPEQEFYSLYPWTAGNGYLGFLEVYDRFVERLHAELIVSDDGDHWERPHRVPWLDRGTDGAWDDMWVFPASNDPLVVDDRMLVFYGGRETAHPGRRHPMRPVRASVGLLWFGRDRYGALTVGQDGGEFVTEAYRVGGDRLTVNADAEFGDVRIALLAPDGGPLEGFRHEDADQIAVDGVDTAVTWRGSGTLGALRDRPVRLHVKAARASVYAFRFV